LLPRTDLAIGTGNPESTGEANRMLGVIRSQLTNPNVPIQYGGSVKPNNIDEIYGSARNRWRSGEGSLEPREFCAIVN